MDPLPLGAFSLTLAGDIIPGVGLIRIAVCGEVGEADLNDLDQRMPDVEARPCVLLVDGCGFSGVSEPARRRIRLSLSQPTRSLAIAVVADTMLPRLVAAALALVCRGHAMRAFQNEKDALRWLARQARANLSSAGQLHARPA